MKNSDLNGSWTVAGEALYLFLLPSNAQPHSPSLSSIRSLPSFLPDEDKGTDQKFAMLDFSYVANTVQPLSTILIDKRDHCPMS